VSWKYYVASDAEEHGASSWVEMGNPRYNRLKELGRLNRMSMILTPKDYSKIRPPENLEPAIMQALEWREKEAST